MSSEEYADYLRYEAVSAPPKGHVEKVEGMCKIVGSRVSLDSIVYAYWNGQTAESIAQSFPTLKLEQVYGAVTFYLAHRAEVDAYLQQRRTDYEARRLASREADPMFYQKMAEARRKLQTTLRCGFPFKPMPILMRS